ncbi:Gfo/Idh/MocA family protein [Paenibacillus silvisoli]|uniref:Gfo/Idh/MocA family protein n=1 Tax=Paenibacillus silvisoli TaxID=3110539 RepID=UPI00280411AE|nr:Gfo/Idh/MocA family oxidoreductase [Paenibacillus silvisoli]
MNRIRIAVVGLNFGSWMIENELLSDKAKDDVEIAAVCDMQPEKAADWGSKLSVPYYSSLDELLAAADADFEAVALFSGPIGRAGLIERILDAGKHVMTTKPFELDSENARRALAKARSLGLTVHLNSPSPELQGDLAQVQQWKERYDLGRPIAFRAETTCSYREQPNGSWYDDPEQCPAAPIFRLGIYLINDLVRFFGDIEEASVQQSRIFTGRPTADNAQLNLLFKNGALGHVFASFCIDDQQYYKCAFTLNFERGTVYRNIGPRASGGGKKNVLELVAVQDGRQVMDRYEAETAEGYQWDVFYRTVRGERIEPLAYDEDIAAGIRIIEQMKRKAGGRERSER